MNYDKDKYKSVEKLIDDFESDKISATLTVAEINKIGYYPIDRYYLHSYWGSTDKDTFIKSIIIPPIQNWQEINDETAMTLIQEMLEMVAEDSIRFDRIREALEKRYWFDMSYEGADTGRLIWNYVSRYDINGLR